MEHRQMKEQAGLLPVATRPQAARSCFTVHVGKLILGLPVCDTQSIFRIGDVTPVALCQSHIAGLTNLRGRIMTVVSLQSWLENTSATVGRGALAIGLQVAGEDYAMVIDRVGEVIDIVAANRMPMPPHLGATQARVMEGLYKIGETLLPVLNVFELFAPAPASAVPVVA
jgi:purine-binding chemotaxis protein CheW